MCNCGKKRSTYTAASNIMGSNTNAVQQMQSQTFAQAGNLFYLNIQATLRFLLSGILQEKVIAFNLPEIKNILMQEMQKV